MRIQAISRIRRAGVLALLAAAGLWAGRAGGAAPNVESSSASYSMQSTTDIARVAETRQQGGTYEILPLVDKANNGLATASGTKMSISWPVGGAEGGLGFDVKVSVVGMQGPFTKVNPSHLAAPPYEVHYKINGTYYYMVFHIDEFGTESPYTEAFAGVVTANNSARNWALYE